MNLPPEAIRLFTEAEEKLAIVQGQLESLPRPTPRQRAQLSQMLARVVANAEMLRLWVSDHSMFQHRMLKDVIKHGR